MWDSLATSPIYLQPHELSNKITTSSWDHPPGLKDWLQLSSNFEGLERLSASAVKQSYYYHSSHSSYINSKQHDFALRASRHQQIHNAV
jgi:hypothetical protein